MSDIFLVPGKRTPFVKAGGPYAGHDAIQVSIPVVQAMAPKARPDFVIWGAVIPSASVSNIARELWLDAKQDPSVPAFSTILACSTSMVGVIEASGMLGRGGAHLALVGGVETMSHVPIALTQGAASNITNLARKNPADAFAAIDALTPADFNLPVNGWTNRISGRSQGQHTEDTAKFFRIAREDQDRIALQSHQRAAKGWDDGFFADLVVPFAGVEHDMQIRRDSTLEKLASLKPAFDFSGAGTLTAGNSTPLTDGAGGMWVADAEGLKKLGDVHAVKLVDWQLEAMDWKEEGILMSPARAIPKLLARHNLRFEDIDLFEIHEAFAAQVLANVKAFSDPVYRREKAHVDADLGDFPWERFNPHGGSLALGHPFGATGARIISQAAKELSAMKSGARAIVSICADGGQGSVLLLQNR